MFRKTLPIVALTALLSVTGCKSRHAVPTQPEATASREGERYLAPPRPDGVQLTAEGPTLSGSGTARSKAQLITPAGEAITGNVDKHGRWAIPLGQMTEPKIFGLSVASGGQRIQAEGYTLVAPDGRAALLRAGGGAVRIDHAARFGVRTLDFDRQGVAVLSAATPPSAAVVVRMDGRQLAQGRADARGRYELALTPSPPGEPHRLQLFGEGFMDNITIELTPPQPLVDGPMRSQLTSAGLRVDWMTPGGGVQSTILVR